MCNPGNSEPWHIDNPGIMRTLTYLKPGIYSEPSQRFRVKCFAKTVKSYNYFLKALILDFWQGTEYAHLSISTHDLVE